MKNKTEIASHGNSDDNTYPPEEFLIIKLLTMVVLSVPSISYLYTAEGNFTVASIGSNNISKYHLSSDYRKNHRHQLLKQYFIPAF